jgi:cell division protein FtsN
MSKDYKNARRGGSAAMTGTAGLLLGLAIGLGVAAAVFIYDRRPSVAKEAAPAPARNATRAAEEDTADDSGQYDFYEMLPKFEVVVPEKEKAEAPGVAPAAAAAARRAGAYVLQVGSYRNFADADRVRAQLALQGVESKIQRISIDNDTWHRVRVGPISDLQELNRTEQRLRQAEHQPLVIRVGE